MLLCLYLNVCCADVPLCTYALVSVCVYRYVHILYYIMYNTVRMCLGWTLKLITEDELPDVP